jgi:hypothetical protein
MPASESAGDAGLKIGRQCQSTNVPEQKHRERDLASGPWQPRRPACSTTGFEIDAGITSLFKTTQPGRAAPEVIQALTVGCTGARSSGAFCSALTDLGRRHACGVMASHYDTVGAALCRDAELGLIGVDAGGERCPARRLRPA